MATSSSAKDLIKKMASDKAFRQSLEGAGTKEARMTILEKEGFGGVTSNEVRAIAKQQNNELTDEQLAAVAGGRPVEWAAVIVSAAALLV
jgi:predicted ribosomally synthesized peptide with nif11-like leader